MEFKKDKHIIIPVALAFAAIIAYRSWQDMHPPPTTVQTEFNSYFLVRDNEMLARITSDKDDQHALAVLAGGVTFGNGKKLAVTPSKVTPVSIPQREVILLYTMDGPLPAPEDTSLEDLGTALHASAETWKEQGDVINDIYLDPQTEKDRVGPLLALVNPLREYMKKDYWLGTAIDRKALGALPEASKKIAEAEKSTRMLIFDAKTDLKPKESLADMIVELDKLDIAFMLRVDEMPDFKTLHDQIVAKSKEGTKNFTAFLLDPEKLIKAAQ